MGIALPPADASLILLHGFTQTGACWGPVADDLARHRRVLCVDLPGHGSAGDLHLDLWETADWLAETANAEAVRAGSPPILVGYSFGGRLALHAALAHPAQVGGLVLMGATPGIVEDSEREQRRSEDAALADRIEAEGVEAFLDHWLSLPLFAGIPPDRSQRAERARNTAAGLAASLRLAGTGSQSPLWDRLGDISCPVLMLTGAEDERFTAIARQMVPLLGGPVRQLTVPAAGHAAHLQRPEAVGESIISWLQV